jgi:hypothetical protein
VKLQEKLFAIAFPAVSFTLAVIVAVYAVSYASALDGVNVAFFADES